MLLRWRPFQAVLALALINLFALFSPHPKSPDFVRGSQPQAADNSLLEASPHIGRVFIASVLRDNEHNLKGGWSDAIVNLTYALGSENVWLSIYESGSRDGTKEALQIFGRRLDKMGVKHRIKTKEVSEDMRSMTAQRGMGHIEVGGQYMLRRIPWLARLRNVNLEPLQDLANEDIFFDKVLFLNDIIFSSADALELLSTRGGNYAAACGFDYSRLWPSISFYDQLATRDIHGAELMALFSPYFDHGQSQKAMLEGSPVPVKSCWSGIAAFDAAPFQAQNQSLRFRAIDDSLAEYHVEASECCLIHYDNPLSVSKGVWMNLNVRVAYDSQRYELVHPPSGWPSKTETVLGYLSSVLTWIKPMAERRRNTNLLYQQWATRNMMSEIGSDCLVNKMMVVSDEGNWNEVE